MAKVSLYTRLRKATRAAAEQAFSELRANHRGEDFYVFAIYTNDAAGYACDAANSEQGLLKAAERYSGPDYAENLRWSSCDWPYHGAGEEHFAEVTAILREAHADAIDDDAFEVHVDKLFQALIGGLKDLDKSGFFGQGKEREKVILLLMQGDQCEDLLLQSAKALNPKSVYEAFAAPMKRPRVGTFTEIGSRKCYDIAGVGVSRDGKTLACAGDYHVFAFGLPQGEENLKKRIGADGSIWSFALAPDGDQLAIGWQSGHNNDGGVERWSLAKKKRLPALPVVLGGVYAVAYSPDSRLLAAAGAEQVVRIWTAATGEQCHELRGHESVIQSLSFSPAGLLASSDREKSVRLWDVDRGRELRKFDDCGDATAFTPDGKLLAVGSGFANDDDDTIRFWDVNTGEKSREFGGMTTPVYSVAFSPDGRLMAVCGKNAAQVWDLASGRLLETMIPDYERTHDLVFVGKAGPVAVVGFGHTRPPVLLWDISKSVENDGLTAPAS